MAVRNRGQLFEIIDGVNKGKQCVAYYNDQNEEAKKIYRLVVRLTDPSLPAKFLIRPSYLKRIGFID